VFLGSAGKFITHIAALQLVDQGIASLDEPVYKHLPELSKLPIISASLREPGYILHPQTKPVTLRQMLTHSSGIYGEGNPLIEAWQATTPNQDFLEDTPMIVKLFSAPLLFEPGEGFCYGHSVHWLQLYITRTAGSKQKFVEHIQEHIFDPLGMTSSKYIDYGDDFKGKLLQAVERQTDGTLVPAPDVLNGLASSVSDLQKVFVDLISPTSKILKKETVKLLFEPAFAPSTASYTGLQADTENYTIPNGLGLSGVGDPRVNFSCAGGLFIEEKIALSHLPPGTVTWNGMPNVVWAMHREKGLAMLFATQLLPVDDKKTVFLIMEFLKGVCARFL
jgi:CubicO group peptidase (beta-lactamase class C family)